MVVILRDERKVDIFLLSEKEKIKREEELEAGWQIGILETGNFYSNPNYFGRCVWLKSLSQIEKALKNSGSIIWIENMEGGND